MQRSGDKSAGDGDMAQLAHAIAIRYKHVLNYTILLLVTHAVLQSVGHVHSSCSVAPWHWPAFLLTQKLISMASDSIS